MYWEQVRAVDFLSGIVIAKIVMAYEKAPSRLKNAHNLPSV
jgi:hypothetical protein